ncbi:MAG: hypothetical protein K6A80_04220 [Saccharofermentans sp.]|nr:hypothetical protein [Saccharofermentans sp.]
MSDDRLTNSTRIMATVGFLYFGWSEFMGLLRNHWYRETGESGLAVMHICVMAALVAAALVLIFGIRRKAVLGWFWCVPIFGYLWAMMESGVNIWWFAAQMLLTLIMLFLAVLGTFDVCRNKAAVIVRFAILFVFLGYIISAGVYYFIESRALGGMAYYLLWAVLLYLTVVNTGELYRPLAGISGYFYFLPAVLALIYVVSFWKDSDISSNLTRLVYYLPFVVIVPAVLAFGYFITNTCSETGLESMTKDRMSFLNTTLVAIPVLVSVVLSLVGADMYKKDTGIISQKAVQAYKVMLRSDDKSLKYSIASIGKDTPPVLFLENGDTSIVVYDAESGKTVTVWDDKGMQVDGYIAKDDGHTVPAFICSGEQGGLTEEIYEFYDGKLHLMARKDADGICTWNGEEVSPDLFSRNYDAYCDGFRDIVWEDAE